MSWVRSGCATVMAVMLVISMVAAGGIGQTIGTAAGSTVDGQQGSPEQPRSSAESGSNDSAASGGDTAVIDPSLKPFIEVNTRSTSAQSTDDGGLSTAETLKSYYRTDDLDSVDVLVNVSVDRSRVLAGEDVSNYSQASDIVSSQPVVENRVAEIRRRTGTEADDVRYLLFANAVLVQDADPTSLRDVAEMDAVTRVNSLMTPTANATARRNESSAPVNASVGNSAASGSTENATAGASIPSPTDPRVYGGPDTWGTSQGAGIGTRSLTRNGRFSGDGVRVGIFDTGANHSDINPDIAGFQDIEDGIGDNDDTPFDYREHGTFVAGNVKQAAPESELFVAATQDYATADYVLALEWFLENDVDVISLSFNSVTIANGPTDGTSQLARLTDRAVDGRYGTGLATAPQPGQGITDTDANPSVFVSASNNGEQHVSGELPNAGTTNTHDFDFRGNPNNAFIVLYWDAALNGQADATVTAPNGQQFQTGNNNIQFGVGNKDTRIVQIQNPGRFGQGDWEVAVDNGPIDEYHVEITTRGGVEQGAFTNPDPSETVTPPATAKRAITVGAVDRTGSIADFSARGPLWDGTVKPDIVGPGVDVPSTVPGPGCTQANPPANCYDRGSGTSYATPLVAGAAALRFEQFEAVHDREPTPTEMRALLANAGRDPQSGQLRERKNADVGSGLLDAQLAARTFAFNDTNTGNDQTIRVKTPSVLGNESAPIRGTLYWDDWEEANDDELGFLLEGTPGTQVNNTIIANRSASVVQNYDFTVEGTNFGGALDNGEAWAAATTYPQVTGSPLDGYTQRQIALEPNATAVYAVPVGREFTQGGQYVSVDGAVRALAYWEDPADDVNMTLQNPSGDTVGYSLVSTDDPAEQVVSPGSPNNGGWKLTYYSNASSTVDAGVQLNYPVKPLPSSATVDVTDDVAGNASSPGSVAFELTLEAGGQPYTHDTSSAPDASHVDVTVGNRSVDSLTFTPVDNREDKYRIGFVAPAQPSTGSYDLTVAFNETKVGVDHAVKTTAEDAITYSAGGTSTGQTATALVIDDSGSMSGSKIANAKQSAREYVTLLGGSDFASVVGFDSSARTAAAMQRTTTANSSNLTDGIDSLTAGGGTDIDDGLSEAYPGFDDAPQNATRAVVLLGDGRANYPGSQVQKYNDSDIPVYTVALGSNADRNVLRRIAGNTGGELKNATTADVQEIYNDLNRNITGSSVINSTSGVVPDNLTITHPFSLDSTVDNTNLRVRFDGGAGTGSSGSSVGPSATDDGPTVRLYYPNGTVVPLNESSPTGTDDSSVSYTELDETVIYQIDDPDTGSWSYEINNTDSGAVDYEATVTGSASATLQAQPDSSEYVNGSRTTLTATLVNSSGGISDATVTANVTYPDGTNETVELTEDASGTYRATVPNSALGTVTASVTASSGNFTRERSTSWDVISPSSVLQADTRNETAPNGTQGGVVQVGLNVTLPSTSGSGGSDAATVSASGSSDDEFLRQAREIAASDPGTYNESAVDTDVLRAARALRNDSTVTSTDEAAVTGDNSTASAAAVSAGSQETVFVTPGALTGPGNATIGADQVRTPQSLVQIQPGTQENVSVRVDVPDETPVGEYNGTVSLLVDGVVVETEYRVNVTESTTGTYLARIVRSHERFEAATSEPGKDHYEAEIADHLTDIYFETNETDTAASDPDGESQSSTDDGATQDSDGETEARSE